MMIGTKPYILRALYEWCLDNNQTPHIAVWVNEQTKVPMQFVKDSQIVLNIGPSAVKDLTIDNQWIHFSARFSGVVHDIWVPVGHVMHFFSRESGEGFGFEVEVFEPSDNGTNESDTITVSEHTGEHLSETSQVAVKSSSKGLKLVK